MVLELIEPMNHLYYAAEEIYYTDSYIYKQWLNIGDFIWTQFTLCITSDGVNSFQ